MFRNLLRSWFQRAAQEKLREKVVEAARQKMEEATCDEAQAEGGAGERPPCDVGVVFALGIEAGGLEDLLERAVTIHGHGFLARRGRLRGRSVVVIRSGPGRQAAARATEALIDGHRPAWIISAGLAGGLSPQLGRNDILMADTVVDAGGDRLSIDLRVDPDSLRRTPGVHVGPLLSGDRVVRLPAEKRDLGEKHQALAVDMETYAAAEVCRRRRFRFLAVRVIGDTADEELAPEVRGLLKQKSRTAKLGAVLGAVWRRPSSVKDMYRLRENALVASDRLGRFLAATIEQLVPLPPAPR
jgi:adenosylhomocysteine nucleosidase